MVLARPWWIFAFVALVASPSFAADGEVPDRLFFRTDERGQSFMVVPPGANETGVAVQFLQRQDVSNLFWTLPTLPADWTISADDGRAILYLSGLDEIVPFPSAEDPTAGADHPPGSIRIVVILENGTGERIATGETAHLPDPVSDVSVRTLDFPLQFDTKRSLLGGDREDADALLLTILIYGRTATNISPVHLLVYSEEHPSALELPGFPYEDQAAIDRVRLAELECLRRTLQRLPCTEEVTPDGDERETPAPALLMLLASVVTACALPRRRQDPLMPKRL